MLIRLMTVSLIRLTFFALTQTPEQQLVAFSRVTLEPEETLSVTLEFPTATLAVLPGDVFTLASPVIILDDDMFHVGGQRVRVTLP
jgi:hypothetical protein